ncbi:MAG: EVE domain-containing protein [Tatlockia sp.]|nr:EVE domain-containing protein [Tatlockia sp.]
MTKYWLLKSDPAYFSIDDLRIAPHQTTDWDGIRNYQARDFIREMSVGDQAFFYHSNCNPPGIIGITEVVSEAYPDLTAVNPKSKDFDAKSTPENPLWYTIDICFKEKFKDLLPLDLIKRYPELASMPLLPEGNQLSVLPISEAEWVFIIQELLPGYYKR